MSNQFGGAKGLSLEHSTGTTPNLTKYTPALSSCRTNLTSQELESTSIPFGNGMCCESCVDPICMLASHGVHGIHQWQIQLLAIVESVHFLLPGSGASVPQMVAPPIVFFMLTLQSFYSQTYR